MCSIFKKTIIINWAGETQVFLKTTHKIWARLSLPTNLYQKMLFFVNYTIEDTTGFSVN